MEYAEEVTINYINYRPLSEVTISHCHHNGYYKLMNFGCWHNTHLIPYLLRNKLLNYNFTLVILLWVLSIIIILLIFAKNYVVINCLIELIRFIVYNVTTYIPANFKFLTNST